MIKVNRLSYSFPQKDLFNHISFTIEEGQHAALIGTSGSGKSTLIHLMMHPEDYLFDGDLEKDAHCKIGYVSQFYDQTEVKDQTVFEYIASPCLALQNTLDLLCTQMETSSNLDALLEQYQNTLDLFELLGGHDFESIIHKQLHLANLTRHKDLLLSQLSGGEFKLVQIIKEMFIHPDLLIMDEPDVFLDFEHLNALKNLINGHKGTLLIITHNRYLLNHCFNKILHLENTFIQEFDGNYAAYHLALLENKIELQELAAADTEEINRNERLINRLRTEATYYDDPARGKALKARVKLQERLESRRIQPPFLALKEPLIQLTNESFDEQTTVLTVCDYQLAFDEILLENVNFEIQSNEKVALIGANGTGKTTLLRDIFKKLNPCITYHHPLQLGYLSQVQDEILKESYTLFETFFDLGFTTKEEIISHLSHYGFDETMMDQKIAALSGGEKNMLQLAKLAVTPTHMLLLDEPTSHLDLYSQIALEKALQNYKGAILMISHDFYSIVNTMDYVLIIEDRTIKKVSMRKFRKNIYKEHFDKDYLLIEDKKKALEIHIEKALKNHQFELANTLFEELKQLHSFL